MNKLFRLPRTVKRDPAIQAWMKKHPGKLGALARHWFTLIRDCGNDVREILHDGCPTFCIGDAAFAYVNAYQDHASVGFFRGAQLPDPHRLLQGTGKFMRHVKLKPDREIDNQALEELIQCAYADMKARVSAEPAQLLELFNSPRET